MKRARLRLVGCVVLAGVLFLLVLIGVGLLLAHVADEFDGWRDVQ